MTIEQLLQDDQLEVLEGMSMEELEKHMMPVLAYEPPPIVTGAKFEGAPAGGGKKGKAKKASAASKAKQLMLESEDELKDLGIDL